MKAAVLRIFEFIKAPYLAAAWTLGYLVVRPFQESLGSLAHIDPKFFLTVYFGPLLILLFISYFFSFRKLWGRPIPVIWIFLVAIFMFSALLGPAQMRPMFILGPLAFFVFFEIWLRVKPEFDFRDPIRKLLILLNIYLISPFLMLFVFNGNITNHFYSLGTFRGFADSRTDYGYLCGLAVLSNWFLFGKIRWVLNALILAALLESGNRAALLALFLIWGSQFGAKILRKQSNTLNVVYVALIFGIFLFLPIVFSDRQVGFFQEAGDRWLILYSAQKQILSNFWLGNGDYYSQINVFGRTLVEPHNAILQSILNFGAIATGCWLILLWTTFKRLSYVSKLFFVYWFIFGMFHVGEDIFLASPESNMGLLFACLFYAAEARTSKGENEDVTLEELSWKT